MRFFGLVALMGVGVLNADSLLNFSYGVLENSRGKEKESKEYFEKAYEEHPDAMLLVRMMSKLRMESGSKRGALEVYERALELKPDEALLHLEYGDFLGNVGKGDAMADQRREQAYGRAREILGNDYLVIERLIRFSRDKQDDVRARELLEDLQITSEQAVQYYVATSKSLYDGMDEEAKKRIESLFGKVIDEHPQWLGTARAASEYFRESGDMEKAIEVLKKHLEARPASLDMKVRLGILYLAAKRPEEGVRELKAVLMIHPKKALAHESLAKHYRIVEMKDEARWHSGELLKIRGGTEDEFSSLAEEFLSVDKVREARLLLEKAVFEYPENAKLMMKFALATARDPETKENAARLFRLAENMVGKGEKTDPAFMLEAAKEMLARGETKAAEERLRNAIRTFPKEATKETAAAMRALADIWIAEGRNLDAANALITRAKALEQ